MAGDSESENLFQRQVQSWLSLLSCPNHPRNCLVLCEQPRAITPPAGLNVDWLPADREHFLAVPRNLGASTNPVVVIVWGHGGTQGATPVFHLRGPRLTPADLATFASGLGPAPSRWILLFPGSGAFARALAAPGREILSSDFDQRFSSDPVGMTLLLDLAKSKPGSVFSKLAEDLGRKTGEWYAQRNLARTEDPTLWLDAEMPRSLLNAGPAPQLAADSAKAPPAQTGAETVSTQPNNGSASESTAMPALGWAKLRRVHPEDYPGSDGVVLSSRLLCLLGQSPAMVTEKDEFIQVLTPEGKRLGDFEIPFAPPQEEAELLECEVQRPDGQIVRLDPEVSGDAVRRAPGDYATTRRRLVSIPGVTPGAVLHLHLRRQWKEFPLPKIITTVPIAAELPVLDSAIEVRMPRGSPFHFRFEGVSAPDPTIAQTGYSTVYSWHLSKVASDPEEPLSAPHRHPGLLISTFADWRDFAAWYSHISQLAAEVTPELSAKAHELALGARTDREKVKAVFNYVTGLRYAAIPLGINSLRPHAAARVLHNQFGDCKDKANLLNALLHSLNIQADLVLVPRFSQAYEDLPGFGFNHAISRVKLGQEILWLDTTEDVCRFGLLPPGDAGRNVLVADGTTVSLTRLEMSEPDQHRLNLQGTLATRDSGCYTLTLATVASGYPDYQFRRAAQEAKGHLDRLPLLAVEFCPFAGSFALAQQSVGDVADLDKDFSWQSQGSCFGLVSQTQGRSALHSPFWLPKEWELALNHRRGALFLNEGYPLTLQEQFEINLPSRTDALGLPANRENSAPPLRWRIEWSRAGPGKVVARLQAHLGAGDLSPADSALFQSQVGNLIKALGADLLMSTPAPPG